MVVVRFTRGRRRSLRLEFLGLGGGLLRGALRLLGRQAAPPLDLHGRLHHAVERREDEQHRDRRACNTMGTIVTKEFTSFQNVSFLCKQRSGCNKVNPAVQQAKESTFDPTES